MHRVIMNPPDDMVVDHIDSNGLNNRRTNLRVCTLLQNSYNRKTIKASSQYKGVRWNKRKKRWVSSISPNGKFILIGYFKDELTAAKAYDEKAKEFFGEFAYLNFPPY